MTPDVQLLDGLGDRLFLRVKPQVSPKEPRSLTLSSCGLAFELLSQIYFFLALLILSIALMNLACASRLDLGVQSIQG